MKKMDKTIRLIDMYLFATIGILDMILSISHFYKGNQTAGIAYGVLTILFFILQYFKIKLYKMQTKEEQNKIKES